MDEQLTFFFPQITSLYYPREDFFFLNRKEKEKGRKRESEMHRDICLSV